jgi:histidyl-tRNA synthetase
MLRLYYITPFFRYERPQKGRLREPHQAGFELVGVASPYADAEVIEATANFYKKLGFGSVTVSLNSIGRAECRNRYRAVVLEKAAAFLVDQSPEFRQRVEKNPLRLLDSKDEAAKQVIRDLPPITDFLEDAGRAHFEELQRILTDHGIPYRLDPSIVRGLDYYTDTVFELVSASLGAQDSLCGGGRYDNLCQELGGKPMPSVGVGIGIERALIAMAALGLNPDEPRPQFFAIVASPEARSALEKIAGKLREKGRAVLFDLEDRSMKSQIKLADKARARFALILGADEIAKGVLLLRDLDASTQSELNLETALETLERLESP